EGRGVGGSILGNTIDGNVTNDNLGGSVLIRIVGATQGNFVIQYNYLENPYSDIIDFGNNSPGVTQSLVMQYNLLQNSGMGTSMTGHPDILQQFGTAVSSENISYNTFYQSAAPAQGGTQGVGLGSEAGNNQSYSNVNFSYN